MKSTTSQSQRCRALSSEHTLNLGNLHQAPQAAFVLTPENHEIDPAIDVEHPPAELMSAI